MKNGNFSASALAARRADGTALSRPAARARCAWWTPDDRTWRSPGRVNSAAGARPAGPSFFPEMPWGFRWPLEVTRIFYHSVRLAQLATARARSTRW